MKARTPKKKTKKSRATTGKKVVTRKTKAALSKGPARRGKSASSAKARKSAARKLAKAAGPRKTKPHPKSKAKPAKAVRTVSRAKTSIAKKLVAKKSVAKKTVAKKLSTRPVGTPFLTAARRRPTKPPRGRRAAVGRRSPMAKPTARVPGVVIKGASGPRYNEILSPQALAFLAELHRKFDATRRELLTARAEQQQRYDAGALPDFLAETKSVRDGDWKVAPIPSDLLDRRVEITGPVDRKMVINALNSGANVYMADFEDANSPTWANNIEGQINLKDRWQGKIDFVDPSTHKHYKLGANPAVLVVRPRGWHLLEQHVTIDGMPMSGSLFDFGLYFFHNAKAQIAQGTGPYFYIPKLETHREARLWNDVFVFAQQKLGIPSGTIKATVLIETLPAAFEMDEILYELRDHIAGLNAGRWDYIFSFIKKLAKNPNYILPDRGQVVMGKAFLGSYAALLVKTCHRRGAFAMGGMAAQIPVKNDPAANEAAFAKVRADKEREVREGHDGTWVAHPDLVPVAKEVFDRLMPQPNQLGRWDESLHVSQADLLRIHEGTKTEEGFRLNIRVGVQYIEAWLRGRGAVPIYNLMEDAATAEISRAQIWQWLQYGATLDNGVKVTPDLFRRLLDEEMDRVKREVGADNYAKGRFPEAIDLFSRLSLSPEFEDFLTVPAYELIA